MNNVDVAARFSKAIAAKDIAELRQIWADDVVIWHSSDEKQQTKSENLAIIEATFAMMKAVEYQEIRLEATPSGFVQQHFLNLVRSGDGKSLRTPVCIVAQVRNEQIYRVDEYVDGHALTAFLSSP